MSGLSSCSSSSLLFLLFLSSSFCFGFEAPTGAPGPVGGAGAGCGSGAGAGSGTVGWSGSVAGSGALATGAGSGGALGTRAARWLLSLRERSCLLLLPSLFSSTEKGSTAAVFGRGERSSTGNWSLACAVMLIEEHNNRIAVVKEREIYIFMRQGLFLMKLRLRRLMNQNLKHNKNRSL